MYRKDEQKNDLFIVPHYTPVAMTGVEFTLQPRVALQLLC